MKWSKTEKFCGCCIEYACTIEMRSYVTALPRREIIGRDQLAIMLRIFRKEIRTQEAIHLAVKKGKTYYEQQTKTVN